MRALAARTKLKLPIVDVSSLRIRSLESYEVARAIGEACREHGFFYAAGHGIDPVLEATLEREAAAFFARPLEEKMSIAMQHGGKAWRGYFPVGAELTSGKPDHKEGIYFGTELSPEDPRVIAGTPMHGANLFLAAQPELREAVLAYIDAMTALGQSVMRGIAMSLGLDESFFASTCARDPLVLFRIFHYPVAAADSDVEQWGVGEHTDYGLLTLLKQDEVGGLEVKQGDSWSEVPVVPGTFVCNIGDMLDRMTRGLYVSTPHRVAAPRTRDRLSFPFFFDPSFDAHVMPVAGIPKANAVRAHRWDNIDIDELKGSYGDYLVGKVSKVFPWLVG